MGMVYLPLLAGLSLLAKVQEEGVEFFERKIRPVLAERCYSCHSSTAEKVKGGLRLDSLGGMLKGGDRGPAVVPGDPDKSPLIQALRYADPDFRMPPKEPLPASQVADFEAWVRRGAAGPARTARAEPRRKSPVPHWAFRPPADPQPPDVRRRDLVQTPVDRFILAKLEAMGLEPVPPADKRTLLRRATYDLIGLPPTPEEIEDFLADASPGAFGRVIDRLLASPHHGERWGRYWLDLVRYSDTAGDSSDYPVPQAYKYRNYVIDSFNRDKPYDLFVREQVAGDLMGHASEAERRERIIGTGFIGLSRRFGSFSKDYPQHLTIEDTLETLGRSVLGLTLGCARCHDHKFDPISTEDYYALYGFFASTRYPFPGIENEPTPRDLVPLDVAAEEAAGALKPFLEKGRRVDRELMRIHEEKATLEQGLPPGATSPRLRELSQALEEVRGRRHALGRQVPAFDWAYAVAEGNPENSRIQIRGDPKSPGREAPRRFIEVLGAQELPPGVRGSGRLHLAGWLADPRNPLTARVAVNRIWQRHFGRGLVATPGDFGTRGKPPTHPELLDYLTARFVERGWSFKAMHRLIMNSRTYQLRAEEDPRGAGRDPGNEYLWRWNRSRLDAESVRDAILAVSGDLDPTPGGAHPFPPVYTWEFTPHEPFTAVYETPRRSVYLMAQRLKKHPLLELFDGADANVSTSVRPLTTTPLQALFLMNSSFLHSHAEKLALRLLRERCEDDACLERAYLLLFGRPPDLEERRIGGEFLRRARERLGSDEAAWSSYARVLLRSNDFIYVN